VREMAESAIETALRKGVNDPEVRETLVRLRDQIGWRQLDSKTRVVYASLLLGLATDVDQMQLAAFHARRAAALAPVTVSVVRAAALVLANTGDLDESMQLIHGMFLFDPRKAATTLGQIDSLVLGVSTAEAVPDDPDAWLAWASELRRLRRTDEASVWLGDAAQRWPEHLQVRTRLSYHYYGQRDWDALAALLPDDAVWPPSATSAGLYSLRALTREYQGDAAGARRDVEIALSNARNRLVHILAGDLFVKLEEPERARTEWTTALFQAKGWGARRALVLRLARLEDEWGRPAAALGYWRQIAAKEPNHVEARRRIEDLTGFTP
jgi:tetratricopeptide (TPR) repeat protein